MDTGQKTESLAQLVNDISKSAVVLPEFQRDFVWEIEKTFDLFDSFVRDIFVGSLIYGIPSFEITVRDLDARPRKGTGSRAKLKLKSFSREEIDKNVKTQGFRLLLDGQQRATSIYRALTGVDDVYLILKEGAELEKQPLEDALSEFSTEQKSGRINIKLSDVYDILLGKTFLEQDKAKLFMRSSKFKNINEVNVGNSMEFYAYLVHSKNLENLFRQEKLIAYYLLDTDAEKFALFFERSNSKGIQLNFIDILGAKLYVGFNLREHIDKFTDENPYLRLNRDVIVRSISFTVSKGRDTGRSYILSSLTHRHFNDHWDRFILGYKKVHEYLVSSRLMVHLDWMPYENMFIPLILFLAKLAQSDFSQITEVQARIIKVWYWLAIFSRRYSSAAQTYVIEDAQAFEKLAVGETASILSILQRLYPVIRNAEDLLNVHKKYDSLYKGTLNFYNYLGNGFLNLENGIPLLHSSNLEDHHIFPKDYLKKIRGTDGALDTQGQIDCVLNRTLVARLSNSKYSNKKPSVYLKAVAANNSNIAMSLSSHLLPDDILNGSYDDRYKEFLMLRGRAVVDGLAGLLKERETLLNSGGPVRR